MLVLGVVNILTARVILVHLLGLRRRHSIHGSEIDLVMLLHGRWWSTLNKVRLVIELDHDLGQLLRRLLLLLRESIWLLPLR